MRDREASPPENRHILVGITGGIAAYKVCQVVSELAKTGAQVKTILTESAQAFITPLTLSTLSRHPCYTDKDFWQPERGRPLHIELGEWADVFVIAPLTANTLAKLVGGMADNLLTNTVLASQCPILLAPAMNTQMWLANPTQRNWQQIKPDSRYHSIGPEAGVLACDTVGNGRMAEPNAILTYIESLLQTGGKQDLTGKRILISAGGTREYLDPVRFLGNPATGKMGAALAQAAIHRGAEVTLVHGPMDTDFLQAFPTVEAWETVSSQQMHQKLLEKLPTADWVVMSAAVGDVRPQNYAREKLPKRSLPEALPLTPIADIITDLSQKRKPHQRLIGFAAQTGDIVTPAWEKLQKKQLDLVVANPIDQENTGFGSQTNTAILLDKQGNQETIPLCSKLQLAHRIFDWAVATAVAGEN